MFVITFEFKVLQTRLDISIILYELKDRHSEIKRRVWLQVLQQHARQTASDVLEKKIYLAYNYFSFESQRYNGNKFMIISLYKNNNPT